MIKSHGSFFDETQSSQNTYGEIKRARLILLANVFFLEALHDLRVRYRKRCSACTCSMMQVRHRSHVSQKTTGTCRSTFIHFSRPFLFNQA